ncbi:unknown protein [Microcystis aeruginosa NIES-843]|uniref:Uncharacterized protein n=1 Tax=Microcystis aeruginosa (strain NIES-843 / IAM M-2473) TaxID=449447 RepID=B0JII7_MICAN|nr:unknown protein [Microcystis aeruginosa NIES-843]
MLPAVILQAVSWRINKGVRSRVNSVSGGAICKNSAIFCFSNSSRLLPAKFSPTVEGLKIFMVAVERLEVFSFKISRDKTKLITREVTPHRHCSGGKIEYLGGENCLDFCRLCRFIGLF